MLAGTWLHPHPALMLDLSTPRLPIREMGREESRCVLGCLRGLNGLQSGARRVGSTEQHRRLEIQGNGTFWALGLARWCPWPWWRPPCVAAVTKTREPGFNRCIHPSQSPITLLPGPGSQTAVFSLGLHGAEGCFYGDSGLVPRALLPCPQQLQRPHPASCHTEDGIQRVNLVVGPDKRSG